MKALKMLMFLLLCTLLLSPEAVFAKHTFGNSLTIGVHETVDDAVSLGDDVYVYGKVRGDAVSLGKSVIVESGGVVDGDVFAFGGDVIVRPGATVSGGLKSYGGDVRVEPGANVDEDLSEQRNDNKPYRHKGKAWGNFIPGIFKGIIFGPFSMLFGALGFFAGFALFLLKLLFSFAVAAVISYLFPEKISSMAIYLKDEFPKAALLGVVIMILTPVMSILMLITIIGIPLVPLFLVFMYLVYLVGSVGVALWIGRIIPEAEGRSMMLNVLFGVLVVGIVKNIPVIGFIVGFVFTAAALGVMLISRMHRNNVV